VGVSVWYGYVSVPGGSGVPSSAPIVFGQGTGGGGFYNPPKVFTGANSTVPATVKAVGTDAITAGGCNIVVFRTNATASGVHWMALGN